MDVEINNHKFLDKIKPIDEIVENEKLNENGLILAKDIHPSTNEPIKININNEMDSNETKEEKKCDFFQTNLEIKSYLETQSNNELKTESIENDENKKIKKLEYFEDDQIKQTDNFFMEIDSEKVHDDSNLFNLQTNKSKIENEVFEILNSDFNDEISSAQNTNSTKVDKEFSKNHLIINNFPVTSPHFNFIPPIHSMSIYEPLCEFTSMVSSFGPIQLKEKQNYKTHHNFHPFDFPVVENRNLNIQTHSSLISDVEAQINVIETKSNKIQTPFFLNYIYNPHSLLKEPDSICIDWKNLSIISDKEIIFELKENEDLASSSLSRGSSSKVSSRTISPPPTQTEILNTVNKKRSYQRKSSLNDSNILKKIKNKENYIGKKELNSIQLISSKSFKDQTLNLENGKTGPSKRGRKKKIQITQEILNKTTPKEIQESSNPLENDKSKNSIVDPEADSYIDILESSSVIDIKTQETSQNILRNQHEFQDVAEILELLSASGSFQKTNENGDEESNYVPKTIYTKKNHSNYNSMSPLLKSRSKRDECISDFDIPNAWTGEIVFVKHSNWPWWPALVIKKDFVGPKRNSWGQKRPKNALFPVFILHDVNSGGQTWVCNLGQIEPFYSMNTPEFCENPILEDPKLYRSEEARIHFKKAIVAARHHLQQVLDGAVEVDPELPEFKFKPIKFEQSQ